MATVGQLMTSHLSTISEEATIKQAAVYMHNERIGSLLVKKEEEFSGIITETDVVRAVAEEEGNISGISVAHVMSKPILSVEKKLSPHYARDLMADKRIRHLAVTEEGKIVGIISARDLLAYFKTVSKEIA
ncbi:cyclic nucleotide-binding/CBS domain-containing protein [Candidatus Nitronereus thalassa]|uniref:CBS domain-containing protein n=1 Tax=Candidatus Nitronereus thalassa TaxID=3020898 RepID=A0ABU3K8T6_9BACT|nr:CBS domain-containing protein [Candidatus Nitronereus thalassa]MDT7042703.1 CBS domain-containing protein [Candidatus Nitronereus thalassa]